MTRSTIHFGRSPSPSPQNPASPPRLSSSAPPTHDRPQFQRSDLLDLPPANPTFSFISPHRPSHTDTPPLLGQFPIPTGTSGCFHGLTFSATGTLRSLTRQTLRETIERYGGRLAVSVSPRTDLLIRGVQEVGPSKLQSAIDNSIPIIDEDGFFTLLRRSKCSNPPVISDRPSPVISDRPSPALLEEPKPAPSSVCPLFIEKYRPQSLDEFVGNRAAIDNLQRWLQTFDRQDRKCVIISGPPGVGKSTAVLLLARSIGYDVIEFNGSEIYGKAAIERIARDAFTSETIVRYMVGKSKTMRPCFIFEEFDGFAALTPFIPTSKVPVICICIDRKGRRIDGTMDISFEQPQQMDIARRLHAICQAEQIALNRTQYFGLTGKASGDLRAAVNALQFWNDKVANVAEKDSRRFDPRSAALDLLKPGTKFESRMDDFFVGYDSVPEFVHDNLWFMGNFEDWQLGLDSMAAGNEIWGAISESNLWELLPAMAVCSTVLPATLVPQDRQIVSRSVPFAPVCFGKTAQINRHLRCMAEVAAKCARNCAVPRSTFRDGIAELLIFKFYDLLQRGQEKELTLLLTTLELTIENVVELREVVDFELGRIPKAAVMRPSFARSFKSAHPHSQNDSIESQRADYLVGKPTKQRKVKQPWKAGR